MLVTALIMGLAGSLHCVGMCSPLAMVVSNMNPHAFLNRIVYNTGRILIYGALGALAASAGFIIPLSKFQNLISILLGMILLLVGIGLLKPTIPLLSKVVSKFTSFIKNLFAKFLMRKTYGSVFFLGALNGLLPCGLVLIALTYCLTLQSPAEGFSFMIVFGAGTLPVMLGLTSLISALVKQFNFNIRYFTTGMLIASGILLIARVFIVQLPHKASLQQGVIDIVLCR